MSQVKAPSVEHIYEQLKKEIEAAKAKNREDWEKRQKKDLTSQSLTQDKSQAVEKTTGSPAINPELGKENGNSQPDKVKEKSVEEPPVSAPAAATSNSYASLRPVKRKLTSANGNQARPFAPSKKPVRGPNKTSFTNIRTVDTRRTANPAAWYENINMRETFSRSDLEAIKQILTLVKKAQRAASRPEELDAIFSEMRKRLHQMEFFDFLSGVLIKKSKILEDQGLPLISDDITYPWDIQADARALFLRWYAGAFDPHLLRGVNTEQKNSSTGAKRTSHRLDMQYFARKDCKVVGENELVNGQWWPLQICAMRDGAHGEVEAGICGSGDKGAFSVILSSGGYDDKDEGDTIYYCGTSGSAGKVSLGTRHLLKSRDEGNPVRVLRSAALPKKNPYRPSKGLRYDGLYAIESYEKLHEETAMHRFCLKRCEGQHPIRYRGVEKRPTDYELASYAEIRGLLGLKS